MVRALLLVAAFFATPPAVDLVPVEPSGLYLLESESYDRETEGTVLSHGVTIITKIGEVYRVESIGTGATVGIGRLAGDTFSVAWRQGNTVGLSVYKVGKNGKLTGEWIGIPGDGRPHAETLTFLRAMPKAGGKAGVN